LIIFLPQWLSEPYDRGMPRNPAAREAWLHIVQLFTSEEQGRLFATAASEVELTPAGLHALLSLPPGEAKPMRSLAGEWHCDPSQVTAIADQLEGRAYAERQASPTDRRAKLLILTERGAAARQRALERLSEPPSGIVALPAADQRALRDLLRQATVDLPALR
jgi:DNA-binding MarR family transcriptional regulator